MSRLTVLLLALALAGCMTPDTADNDNTTGDLDPSMPAEVPAPIEESRTVQGGADPTNFVTGEICGGPTANCQRHPFELNTTATVIAGLSWGIPSNDFDLYLFKDGEQTETLSGNAPPGTTESFEADLDPGSYEVVVVPWAVSQDTYTLTVNFEAIPLDETADNESI